ncbi:hypothetical protein M0802_009393 [Mischocyttarus mexicanus]|nr:hypothetical protein M0802_009393 [Mischocyttarus mexicanus]
MPIDFYYFPLSPPCRMILLLGKAIGVHFNLKSINPLKGEQMKAEFLKINPQHTIPTIDDNNIVLWERQFPIFFGKRNTLDEKAVENLEKSCEILNRFLEDNDYVAGENLTIADFSISTSIVMLETFEFDITRYNNVVVWYDRCKTVMEKFGFEEIHATPKKVFNEAYRSNLGKVV